MSPHSAHEEQEGNQGQKKIKKTCCLIRIGRAKVCRRDADRPLLFCIDDLLLFSAVSSGSQPVRPTRFPEA